VFPDKSLLQRNNRSWFTVAAHVIVRTKPLRAGCGAQALRLRRNRWAAGKQIPRPAHCFAKIKMELRTRVELPDQQPPGEESLRGFPLSDTRATSCEELQPQLQFDSVN
jgi:hypothetical protein